MIAKIYTMFRKLFAVFSNRVASQRISFNLQKKRFGLNVVNGLLICTLCNIVVNGGAKLCQHGLSKKAFSPDLIVFFGV